MIRIYRFYFRWMKYEHETLVEWYCQRKLNYSERNLSLPCPCPCPCPTLSTTNSIWTLLGSNASLSGERPCTPEPCQLIYSLQRRQLFTYLLHRGLNFISLGNDAVLQNMLQLRFILRNSLGSKRFCNWELPLLEICTNQSGGDIWS